MAWRLAVDEGLSCSTMSPTGRDRLAIAHDLQTFGLAKARKVSKMRSSLRANHFWSQIALTRSVYSFP